MEKWNFLNWDDALSQLLDAIQAQEQKLLKVSGGEPLVILRDWQGKITLCMPCSREALSQSGLKDWSDSLSSTLGLLASAADITYCKDEFFDPDDVWMSPNTVEINVPSELKVSLLDRQDKENDWLRQLPSAESTAFKPRAVFFGVKGGVGRSSALTALALHLADMGKNVLVVDADFESPGVSSSLLDHYVRPDFGLVDWMTAHALGCESAQLMEMAATKLTEVSPLSQLTKGRIVIAPSHAKLTQAYIAKLGRIYRTTEDGVTFAQRLNEVVSTLETAHNIDVTLIDSRAGIDDTAAATITQLHARVTFLFAIKTAQTWDAYRLLFHHLQGHPSLHTKEDFRDTLRIVSALTPDEVSANKGYWEDFQQKAYETCVTLYDVDDGSGDERIYSPSPDDEESPHYAAKIMWHEVLRAFDPLVEKGQIAPALIENVFGDFLAKATVLLGDS
jgi:CobQ/CobB/MinD/ParA nucleotide binding domain